MSDIQVLEAVLSDWDGDCLEHYAARAAVEELAQNWRDAIRDDLPLKGLTVDIERTVDLLHMVQAEILKRLDAAEPHPFRSPS